ncbi:hypothetical protein HYV50_03210 [Candidatus Pacearchaeota archaeon]|nr:hypothetical protein [Candidatus Pacearchaeota archaeon]
MALEQAMNNTAENNWYREYVTFTTEKKFSDLLREAYKQAWYHSDDDSTKTGVLLVDKKLKILVKTNNHFPPGTGQIPGALERPKKYTINNHAERAAVYKAAKKGIKTEGLIMIMPWAPCLPCANAIIYSGINKLVCHKQMVDRTLEDWRPELRDAFHLLKVNNIKILMYDGKIGRCRGIFRHIEWQP